MIDLIVWLCVAFVFAFFVASCGLLFGAVYGGLKLIFESDDTPTVPMVMPTTKNKTKGSSSNNYSPLVSDSNSKQIPVQPALDDKLLGELTSALTNLGYKKTEAKQIAKQTLVDNKVNNIADGIRYAMKLQ